MGLRDRLRLLVRPLARADAPAPSPVAARVPVGPPPVSIPTRIDQVPLGATGIDIAALPAAPFAALRGPLLLTSRGDGGAGASVAAERLAAFGVAGVSWLAAEPA